MARFTTSCEVLRCWSVFSFSHTLIFCFLFLLEIVKVGKKWARNVYVRYLGTTIGWRNLRTMKNLCLVSYFLCTYFSNTVTVILVYTVEQKSWNNFILPKESLAGLFRWEGSKLGMNELYFCYLFKQTPFAIIFTASYLSRHSLTSLSNLGNPCPS